MRKRFGTPGNVGLWMPPLALSVLWTLSFLAISPTPFQGIDYTRFYEPYQHFLRESLMRGEIPWWNPYSSLGRPFLADLQTAVLYPATILMVAFGAKAGWVIGTLLHGWAGAEGMGRLVRRFGASAAAASGAAAVFLFCGPLVGRMQEGEVNYVYALCLLPWVLLFAAGLADEAGRRRWAALSLTLALQLACGHPQIFWLSAVAAGLFTTGWLASPPWGAAGGRWLRTELALLGACLAAMALLGCVLVPFMQLVSQSNRSQPSIAFSGAFSMGGSQWMSLAWPSWGAFGVNWEYNLFVGVAVAAGGIAVLLRCREPAARGAAAMAAGAALIAAGPSTPVFALLFEVLPGLSSFRVPARAGVLVTVALIIGAALLAGAPSGARRRKAAAGLAAAALLGAALYALASHPGRVCWAWLGVQALLSVAAGLGWWLWTGDAPGGRGRFVLPLAVMGGLCLSLHGIKQAYRFISEFPLESTVIGAIRSHEAGASAAPVRVCVDPEVFRENAGMIYHVGSVVGYESLSLARVWNYLHLAAGADPSHAYSTVPSGLVYGAAPGLHSVNLSASLALGGDRLVFAASPDPRAYLAVRTRTVANAPAAIRAMVAGADFHAAALVEDPYSGACSTDPDRPAGTATISRFGLNTVDIDIESPGRAVLVLAEAWYPGWEAEIGGRPVPCVPVNGWMRGVPVPAGKAVVHMHFRQGGLMAGAWLSAAGALAIALAGLPRRRSEQG